MLKLSEAEFVKCCCPMLSTALCLGDDLLSQTLNQKLLETKNARVFKTNFSCAHLSFLCSSFFVKPSDRLHFYKICLPVSEKAGIVSFNSRNGSK